MSERPPEVRWAAPEMKSRLARRHASERRFHRAGFAAVCFAMLALALLISSLAANGRGAFVRTELELDVSYAPELVGALADLPDAERERAAAEVDWAAVVRAALQREFPDVSGRGPLRELAGLASAGARSVVRERFVADPSLAGRTVSLWVPADDEVDRFVKGDGESGGSRLSEPQRAWLAALEQRGRVKSGFDAAFLTSGDSREPELAGVGGAIVGSILTLVVTLAVAFPLGAAAAVYLEEFAPRRRWTEIIEVNINNLAAVPSIVFGLLGLAVFLGFFGLPRSAPLVGGLTLALMTLPTIIIAGRSAIAAVPPSIREAARGLGASPVQVVMHHVLPLALPGILTGTIIGMARALGETAPLLMVGMVAFVVDVPKGFVDAATALPVQIYLWADSPERAFVEKVSGAILVLLAFLVAMNGAAILLRQRFERRW